LAEKTRFTAFDPGDDTLVAIADGKLALTPLKIAHPESSLATFFGSVWYEGYSAPQYVWQSSAGTEKAESKLSLMPLVFGTLKATLYAMLVSVPLALMAAIYTSEFLSATARSRVKPVVEMMASLPSVVLGFVAALVIAPLLQSHLLSVLIAIMVVPCSFILAGHLWNLLPLDKIVRWERARLFALIACLPISVWCTGRIAPVIESMLFDGDLVGWINSGSGSAVGGWMLVLIPLNCFLVAFLLFFPLAERTRSRAVRCTPRGFAIFSLLRLLIATVSVIVLAWLIALMLNAFGLDARGSLFGSYQDRNALLVGLALGFCVIPIIYTISDDALQAVPKQLRSASLGCGATPWQTTMRVVVPSAMSGLFSAIMIGLGRAVGETMVVLMAAGNTPVMDWNPFNGFRTLSATLATELPEAAKGSTHFRTLFLAALLLFVLTLIANTIAEFVRIRFRKRASQL
jgi:phosphate transport system permease protein